jgi:hypothetical protein
VSGVRIGIDFDNTIICYDGVFAAAALRRELVPRGWTGSKIEVREYLQAKPGGELAWQGLQGWVYGKGIGGAEIYPGVLDFLGACRHARSDVYIVSHKTRFGHQDAERVDLRAAARDWLRAAGLIGGGNSALGIDNVHFEDTQAAKIERLATLNLDVFIDDLADVFEQPHFPRDIRSILFDASASARPGPYQSIASWDEIRRAVFAS